jgi:hypothetical protein
MKKIFIGIFIIIIVTAAFLWFLFHPSSPSVAPGSSSVIGTTTGSSALSPVYQIPASATIILGTLHGLVTVKNFYKTALGAEDEFIIITQNDNYEINYNTTDSGFYLDIKQAPFDANRASAETNFLNLLGVSQVDACKLTVAVGVEPTADSGLSGKALPLSFCASSTFDR